MNDFDIPRMVVLASRAKTRVKVSGDRGVLDITHEETLAMAFFCDVFLEDYAGPLTRCEPDLEIKPNPETETTL